jgi:molybdenum cofactor cytidylyltransferase
MPAIIILAAGESARLGQPKQLLKYKGKTLVQHAIDAALATDFEQVVLVLGASAQTILAQANIAGVEVCVNGHWQEGMASSLRLGLSTLEQLQVEKDCVIIMLCDQPFVTTELLQALYDTQLRSGKRVVACQYKDTAGVPVLFHHSLFPELMKLQGGEGAKKLLPRFADDTALIPFPEGETDIDTMEDYDRLLHKQSTEWK